MSVLYLSYNGLMEQLGQSQVFPYLRHLARTREIRLVTFEKGSDLDDVARRKQVEGRSADARVTWIPLRYHKHKTAKVGDLVAGFCVCSWQCLTRRIRIVHARGYVMAVLALMLKWLFRVRFIFDMRGFYVDQQVESGVLQAETVRFRAAKRLEGLLLRNADVVCALSAEAVEAMKQWPEVAGRSIQFEVVTTCTDLDLFRPAPKDTKSVDRPFTLGYAGNAGRGYLFEPVLDVYEAVRAIRPDARLKIVNRADHAMIRDRMKARHISENAFELISSDYREMPRHLREMDLGLFFYQWTTAHVSSVPTRMGEFLASGVPCVANVSGARIVDVLEGENVGVVLRQMDSASIRAAAASAVDLASTPDVRDRCVQAAARHFSLKDGVATYERIYQQLEAAP